MMLQKYKDERDRSLRSDNVADMHTHSENSHDSLCKIEDMLLSQLDKGTHIFAVTDHFDTHSYTRYDVFKPIERAYDEILYLNKKYEDRCMILAGIEISEGFWHPDVYKKVIKLRDYDVVIGSVHLVNHSELNYAYSAIDFSEYTKDYIAEYLDSYFNDVITMIDKIDFNILAHLTCPLRYICGKYKIKVDMSLYEEKIEEILSKIIKKHIALEVNTSSYELLDCMMPDIDILKKYYNMGGRLITLGSDAHVSQKASANFETALQKLRQIGFKHIYYYKKRKPYEIEI